MTSQSDMPSILPHSAIAPPRLGVLDCVFRALVVWGGLEFALLIFDLASRPNTSGIAGQDFFVRVFLGLLIAPTLLLVASLLLWRLPGNVVPRFLVLLSLEAMTGQLTFNLASPSISTVLFVFLFIIPATGFVAPSLGYLMMHFPDGQVYPPQLASKLKWIAIVKFLGVIFEVMASPAQVKMFLLGVNPLYVPALAALQPIIAVTIGVTGVMLPLILAGGMVSLLLRYRVAQQAVRQQIKWVIGGFAVLLVAMLTAIGLFFSGITAYQGVNLLITFAGLAQVVFIATIAVATMRHHLYDIDLILSRTLVYGGMTTFVIGTYVLCAGVLGAVFQTGGNYIISLLASAAIAVLFQPLRELLQKRINHLIYGERDEPYAVLSRLGERLEATFAPDAVLPTIVETVAQALKVPYVAIALRDQTAMKVIAEAGRLSGRTTVHTLKLPLVYQQERIGEFIVAPRVGEDKFGDVDLRLLNDLARQTGIAAYSVRLTTELRHMTADLQRSRARLISAREEERRRLRRDLHDGLGPTLAALALTASTARDLIATDPAAAATLATELQTEIRSAVAEIRRLVYDLRPPTLDELGLVAAIRDSANHPTGHLRSADGAKSLAVSVVAPDPLPPLPAAVEVAAYRIAQEAVTNVIRHAHASECMIRISLDDATDPLPGAAATGSHPSTLVLEICDNGDGLPAAYRGGVGLRSMRERAAELGGTCAVENAGGCQTRVVARLPIYKE